MGNYPIVRLLYYFYSFTYPLLADFFSRQVGELTSPQTTGREFYPQSSVGGSERQRFIAKM
jgi:hypothetical protein